MVNRVKRFWFDLDGAVKPVVDFVGSKSFTNQADKSASDINLIMARYEKTGFIQDLAGNQRVPVYGDFTGVGDYHAMLSAVRRAESYFSVLPASVRNRFDNDPQLLIDFLNDPKNDVEAVKLGLRDVDRLAPAPSGAPVAPPPGGVPVVPDVTVK